MIVFARPILQKTCLNCPTPFDTKNPAAKYCDVCRPLMKAAKNRECRLRGREGTRTTAPPFRPAARRVPTLRARTLAETPDVPAEAAARGDQLTGGAPAGCTAGRVIHTSGGME